MSKEFKVKVSINDDIKEFTKIEAYDLLYSDAFLKFDVQERRYSCYCKKCNKHEKDMSLKSLVDFIDSHEELFSVNNLFYFFKCKKDM